MKSETREIAEKLERMQRRYQLARTVSHWVTALAVAASSVLLGLTLHEVTELQRDSSDRQKCLLDLVYTVVDREAPAPPPLPPSCEEVSVPTEVS